PLTATTDLYTLSLHDALPIFVAVGLAFGGASQVQALRSERWQLNPAITERGRPARQVRQVVERCLRPEKLRKEDGRATNGRAARSEEHTSELQSRENLVCRLL